MRGFLRRGVEDMVTGAANDFAFAQRRWFKFYRRNLSEVFRQHVQAVGVGNIVSLHKNDV
jgi:hypothetical protein